VGIPAHRPQFFKNLGERSFSIAEIWISSTLQIPSRDFAKKHKCKLRNVGISPFFPFFLHPKKRMFIAQLCNLVAHPVGYAKRAGIEGTLSQGVRMGDLRRTRYIGLPKTRLLHLLIAAALNVVRIAAWLAETPLAQTRTPPFVALGKAAA
jgi:hypothetical protein